MTVWTPRDREDRSDSSTIVELAIGMDFGRAVHQAITSLAVRLEDAVRFFFFFFLRISYKFFFTFFNYNDPHYLFKI